MTVAHYRINELDAADRVVDGYSVMCRSDTAALAMASKGAENRAAAVEVWEDTRHVARLIRCRRGIGSGASGPVSRQRHPDAAGQTPAAETRKGQRLVMFVLLRQISHRTAEDPWPDLDWC